MNQPPNNEELKKALRELRGAMPDPEAFDTTWEQIQLAPGSKVISLPFVRLAAACGAILIAANAWMITQQSSTTEDNVTTSEQIYTDLNLYGS